METNIDVYGLNTIVNNINSERERISNGLSRSIAKAVLEGESIAKRKLTSDGHIDTGNLRGSILGKQVSKFKGKIETKVFYSIYVEAMDSYMGYMFNEMKSRLPQIINENVRV